MNDFAGLAALIVAVSGFVGLWWQRRLDQRKLDAERIAAAQVASEQAAEDEIARMRLVHDIENERLASFKAELADLRAQLRAERDERAKLQAQFDTMEKEHRRLLMFGRAEDQARIAELEKQVAHQAEEIRELRGAQ